MSRPRLFALVVLTMIAFAGNSLLCRLALHSTQIDPATFTTIRLCCGAIALWLIVRVRDHAPVGGGNWVSAFALFAYAAAFSFAYVTLSAGTGALLLFGAVQATMIGWGLWNGERLQPRQVAGLGLASAGLVGLVLPGVSAPSPGGSLLMIGAGIAWGVYSLRGRGGGDATRTTAGNFLRAVPFALALSAAALGWTRVDGAGIACAIASGALTSGVGYAIWYAALPLLSRSQSGIVQLAVPAIAALAGIAFLGEEPTLRLGISTALILGGVAVAIAVRPAARR